MSKHEENCQCGKELDELLGTALAEKLSNETYAAVRVTEKTIADMLTAALKTRRELLLDELPHLSQEARDQAVAHLYVLQSESLLCCLLRMSATVGLATGDLMSTFVGHAAQHYEAEVVKMAANSFTAQEAAVRHSPRN